MNPSRFFATFCLVATLFFNLTASAAVVPSQASLTKKRVLADLDCIHTVFSVKYAPTEWKKEFANWELNDAIEDAKAKINSSKTLTLKDCQVIVRDFFHTTQDYHVNVRFYATENAALPFLIKGAQGRYFICYVEDVKGKKCDFEVGDEILTFGGRPIHDVVEELRQTELGNNVFETDRALAEFVLTHRRGDLGHSVPSGKVKITGIRKSTKKAFSVESYWEYFPEKIRDFSKLAAAWEDDFEEPLLPEEESTFEDIQVVLKESQFFKKMMVLPMWDQASVNRLADMNSHALGARKSYIPPLGAKLWQSGLRDQFDAYIFVTPSGKKVGYIRIPHFVGDDEEVDEFGTLVDVFQSETDALVIDQINNPGGSVFYLYGLAATLTDKPLATPKHRLALTQDDVYFANRLLPLLMKVRDDYTARRLLGETLGGYPIDYQFALLMKQFCQFLIDQWEKGKLFSDPTYLFGVDEIKPHPDFCYSKPILFLVNSLDFSCGDFFPAILQDNQRATIFGTRTAGAGGYVLRTAYPNHTGIKSFSVTGSLATRKNNKLIENVGVIPDIQYELSVRDLQENYVEYVAAIVAAVEAL